MTLEKQKLPGYRPGLKVYEVSSCPPNESSWRSAAERLGCNLDIGNPASSSDFYYCIPTQSKSTLVEFCYDSVSSGKQSGECLQLTENGYLETVDCSHFVEGCPGEAYLPETIYKYQACLNVNTDQRCYLQEEGCEILSSLTTNIPDLPKNATSSVQLSNFNVTEFSAKNATESSLLSPSISGVFTSPTTQTVELSTPQENHIFGSAVIIFMCLAVIICIVLMFTNRRKVLRDIPAEIFGGEEDRIQNYLEQLEHGKVKVYHARGMIVGCAGAGKTTLLERLKGKSVKDIRHIKPTRSVDIQSDIFAVEGNKISVVSENERISHFDINQSKITSSQNVEYDIFSEIGFWNDSDTDKVNKASLDENEDERKSNIIHETETKQYVNQSDEGLNEINIGIDENYLIPEGQSLYIREEDTEQALTTLEPIQEFKFSSVNKTASSKTITFTDFAGHLAYYVTHEIFLNRRAFYLLVIDLSRGLDKPIDEGEMFMGWTCRDVIKHWMKLIYAVHSSAPIILVGTHAKGYKKQDVKEIFKTIWDMMPHQRKTYTGREFAVELLNQEKDPGIEDIKDCICKILLDPGPGPEHIPWGEERPTSWVIYEDYLRTIREKNKIIRTVDLWDTIQKQESNTTLRTEEDMRYMLQFFHDTGIILFFDEESLREYIVVDIPWFVRAFKHIISDPVHTTEDLCELKKTFTGDHRIALDNLQMYGILTSNLLRAVWNLYDISYGPLLYEIMMYMERLGMLAELTTVPDTWYIPCLNKKSLSDVNFDGYVFSSSLCFQLQFLPPSIYYRLIATCLNKLGFTIRSWPRPQYFYKDAVLLHENENFLEFECFTLIQYMNDKNTIEVQILSERSIDRYIQRASWLKLELMKHFNTLMTSFHSNLGKINIGYRCRITSPGMKTNTHILSESDFARRPTSCTECTSLQEVSRDIFSYWNQTPGNEEALAQGNDLEQTNKKTRTLASQEITFLLESSLDVPEVVRCWHIACVSSESAWICDHDGLLRLVDKHGSVTKTVSGRRTQITGSHTVTREGDLLFIDGVERRVYRLAGEEPILFFETDKCYLRSIFSSPRNGHLLIGGYIYENGKTRGRVMRYRAATDMPPQKFKKYLDEVGRDIYNGPYYITENVNGDVILSDGDKLVVLDEIGRHRFIYPGPLFRSEFSPHGICTDTSGRILVCVDNSKSVHILTRDGEFLSLLQTRNQGIETPWSICMDNEQGLWVGDWNKNRICIFRYRKQQ